MIAAAQTATSGGTNRRLPVLWRAPKAAQVVGMPPKLIPLPQKFLPAARHAQKSLAENGLR
jgi:hypothetical protein